MSTKNIFSLLTLLAAIATVAGAFYSVYTAREIARQKTSLEFLEKHKKVMQPFHDSVFASVFEDSDEITKQNVKFLLISLNQYERISSGLKNGVYDEQVIFDILSSDMVSFYEHTKPIIEGGRKQIDQSELTLKQIDSLNRIFKMYANFEKLVEKAKANLAKK